MRIHIRVTPGSAHDLVGGRYGDDDPPQLIVRVRARAVDGSANRAAIDCVARAFGLKSRAVTLLSGARSRHKVLDADGADEARLAVLLSSAPPPSPR